jgi:hypothetical protein
MTQGLPVVAIHVATSRRLGIGNFTPPAECCHAHLRTMYVAVRFRVNTVILAGIVVINVITFVVAVATSMLIVAIVFITLVVVITSYVVTCRAVSPRKTSGCKRQPTMCFHSWGLGTGRRGWRMRAGLATILLEKCWMTLPLLKTYSVHGLHMHKTHTFRLQQRRTVRWNKMLG